MMRDELVGFALFLSHVCGLAISLQILQFGLVEPWKNVPIGRMARIAAIPHQNFQAEIAPEGNQPSVGSATPPDPGSYDQ
jgi:hypothetical protein